MSKRRSSYRTEAIAQLVPNSVANKRSHCEHVRDVGALDKAHVAGFASSGQDRKDGGSTVESLLQLEES